MLIYLMRHAEAHTKEEDPRRGITDAGRTATKEVARRFAERVTGGVPLPEEVWHSDKLRARQTAEIMAAALGAEERLIEREMLQPLDDVSATAKALTAAGRPLLIVGHMPFQSRLCSFLLSGETEAEPVDFATSELVCLQSEPWVLLWRLAPDSS